MDHLFSKAESQQAQIFFSAWNVGEVLGVLDERYRKKQLTREGFAASLFNFADETVRLARQGAIQVLPVSAPALVESWQIFQEEHLYQADALQIASCKRGDCDWFVTADKPLLETALRRDLAGLDAESDEKRLLSL